MNLTGHLWYSFWVGIALILQLESESIPDPGNNIPLLLCFKIGWIFATYKMACVTSENLIKKYENSPEKDEARTRIITPLIEFFIVMTFGNYLNLVRPVNPYLGEFVSWIYITAFRKIIPILWLESLMKLSMTTWALYNQK